MSPGGFLWNPGLDSPYRSPQIFKEYLDDAMLNSLAVPIPNSNMTTIRFSVTTVANPALGVLAGQPVEILFLNLNAMMTTMVIGETAVRENTKGLVEMVNHIAFNKVLLERVSGFVNGD